MFKRVGRCCVLNKVRQPSSGTVDGVLSGMKFQERPVYVVLLQNGVFLPVNHPQKPTLWRRCVTNVKKNVHNAKGRKKRVKQVQNTPPEPPKVYI